MQRNLQSLQVCSNSFLVEMQRPIPPVDRWRVASSAPSLTRLHGCYRAMDWLLTKGGDFAVVDANINTGIHGGGFIFDQNFPSTIWFLLTRQQKFQIFASTNLDNLEQRSCGGRNIPKISCGLPCWQNRRTCDRTRRSRGRLSAAGCGGRSIIKINAVAASHPPLT